MTVDRARMEKETAFATSAAPTPVPCSLAAWHLPAACSRLPRATCGAPSALAPVLAAAALRSPRPRGGSLPEEGSNANAWLFLLVHCSYV